MVRLARQNLASLRGRRAGGEVVAADAVSFDVPDEVTVIFLYNPFQGATFDAAIQRVIESHDRRPRDLLIAYANPVEEARIAGWSRLRRVRRLQLAWRPTEPWRRTLSVAIYRVVPPGDGPSGCGMPLS
jgi:hypothetical protein